MALMTRLGAGGQLAATDRTGLDITSTVSIACWLRSRTASVTLFSHDNTTGAADGYALISSQPILLTRKLSTLVVRTGQPSGNKQIWVLRPRRRQKRSIAVGTL